MKTHLVGGTYEFFRSQCGAPPRRGPDGLETGATVGLLRSLFMLLSTPGAPNAGCTRQEVVDIVIPMADHASVAVVLNGLYAAGDVFIERDEEGRAE